MEKPSKDLLSTESRWLTLEDFEFLCFNAARELLAFNEPIPNYETRNDDLLASALGSPQQGVGSQLLYPTLIDQAAILFYSLIKNHPFQNGNKRIAVMSLLVFLSLNKKWLRIPAIGLYELACKVAEYDSTKKDLTLRAINTTLKEYLINK